jgi:hypothetical protein
MVYCGKLSKACLPCRQRRLLCDLRKGGCGQCKRARLPCTGYRDTTAIRIEDQTSIVEQKAISRRRTTTTATQILSLSICHQARELFYHDHVFGVTKGYSFLSQYYSFVTGDAYLCRSIDAVSLAYLSHQKRSSAALAEARRHYVDAVRLIRKALQSLELAAKDSTLLSTLLLDVYEKISNKGRLWDGSWTMHIKGALSLVQLRHDRHHHDPNHRHVLERLSTNILISCAVSDSAVPDELLILQKIVASPPKLRESELMAEFACLKRQAKFHLLPDDDIIRKATELDLQFLELSLQMPPSWQHETMYVEAKSAHHYEKYHYIHTDEYVGQMRNVLRITRILICELIVSYGLENSNKIARGSTLLNSGYAFTTIAQMTREICATVPEVLTQPANAKSYLQSYRLIFPLYVAAQSVSAPEAMKNYAIQQLRHIADYHAIKNASTVAKILESGERRNPWEVYALLGSYAFVC